MSHPNEINRLTAWEEMSNRIGDISHNKNVVVLGDFNAAIHARKAGEEECLGPHIWGKGLGFLREKEGLLPENMNRSLLIDLLKGHDMRCMNVFSPKNLVIRKLLIDICGQEGCRNHGTQKDTANSTYV